MTHSPVSAERRSHFSASFQRRLNAYGLQASAAGVGLLALVQHADARIIYTPTHHVIANGDTYELDFNHGVTDLTLRNWATTSCTSNFCRQFQRLAASLAPENQVVHNVYGAVAMKPGMLIGSRRIFRGRLEPMAIAGVSESSAGGSWVNVNNRYLGIKFKINGDTHYGWARLSVQIQFPLTITATLTGYAYETTPNKAIIAGETNPPDVITAAPDTAPGSLGTLALGRQ